MAQTILRELCGTFEGLKTHLRMDEIPCGECRAGEALRKLEAEGVPRGLPPMYAAVTADEGARNREILAEAVSRRRGGRRG